MEKKKRGKEFSMTLSECFGKQCLLSPGPTWNPQFHKLCLMSLGSVGAPVGFGKEQFITLPYSTTGKSFSIFGASENLLLKVSKDLPPLPNPITPLLRKEVRINAITSKESVSYLYLIAFNHININIKTLYHVKHLFSWQLSLLRERKEKKDAKNSIEIGSSEEPVDFENDPNTSFGPQQEQLTGQVDQSTEKEAKQASIEGIETCKRKNMRRKDWILFMFSKRIRQHCLSSRFACVMLNM